MFAQVLTLAVLAALVVALVSGRVRPELAALSAAALLAATGVVGAPELQRAFGNSSLIALASLFMLVRGLERAGVIDLLLEGAGHLVERFGRLAAPLVIGVCAVLSAFMNSTPLVVAAAPVVRETALRLGWSPKRLLAPLSFAVVLAGCCTLIGTSTNLLVDAAGQAAGQPAFTLFEIAPVGLPLAAVGLVYLLVASPFLLPRDAAPGAEDLPASEPVALDRRRAVLALLAFGAVLGAICAGAPLAPTALAGAVLLLALGVLSLEEAYGALQPGILLLIAGMLIVGLAVDRTGLAVAATAWLAEVAGPLGPLAALAALYLAVQLATEILSNAAVAVLMTPLAVGLAQNLGVDERPFLVAIMMAASAAFATPFGYQTNTIVYVQGGYRVLDFVKLGLPLNVLTLLTALWAIPRAFPF